MDNRKGDLFLRLWMPQFGADDKPVGVKPILVNTRAIASIEAWDEGTKISYTEDDWIVVRDKYEDVFDVLVHRNMVQDV